MSEHDHAAAHQDVNYYYEKPSNAWIWIILVLLAIIVGFFALGGAKLFDTTTMSPAEIGSAVNGTQ